MPTLEQGGAMTIVAHADDDLLFMNPDIATGIASGATATTVFVTAGDAGYDSWYWQGRELGAKAAYALMAGVSDWVDETVTITHGGASYDVASSYLDSAPQVRLYFLRLPDGAGAIEDPADYESLARLEDGTRQSVETVDGASSYTRSGLIGVLTGLMEAHDPSEFRLQVADGDHAVGEHTDHIHTTEFALEALRLFSGTDFQVTHYVNYQTDLLEPNLSEADAEFSLRVMETYAAFDWGTTDEFGTLLSRYVDWTGRQYIAESYSADALGDVPPPSDDPEPEPPVLPDGDFVYSLGTDPDNFLFDVNPQTGAITPKDWFHPSLDDAWDVDEDYIYEVTLIATPLAEGETIATLIRYETTAEGELTQIGGPPPPVDDPVPPEDDPVPPIDDPVPPEDDPIPPVDDPVDPVLPTLNGATFALMGPDEFLFEIDSATGDIAPKDWFVPSYDDAWDQNEDHIYDLTRTASDAEGSLIARWSISYEVTVDDALTLISATEDVFQF